MKLYILSMLSLAMLLQSCSSIFPNKTEENSVDFQLQRYNSDMNYDAAVEEFVLQDERFNWFGNPEVGVSLYKDYTINVSLDNDVEQEIGISFFMVHFDPTVLDVIGTDGDINFWHFTDVEQARSNFYDKLDGIRITINNSVVFLQADSGLEDLIIEEVSVDGEDMLLLKFELAEFSYGWYDPEGEWSEYFEIKNGKIELLTKP